MARGEAADHGLTSSRHEFLERRDTVRPSMHSLMDELSVGPIIYGCMRIGGAWSPEPPSPDERASAFRALDTAHDCGARLFDHADIYTCGRSETLFGEWLRSRGIPRDRVLIQSKCGIRPGEGDAPDRYDFSREHILGSVEGILARLGVDNLDCPDAPPSRSFG